MIIRNLELPVIKTTIMSINISKNLHILLLLMLLPILLYGQRDLSYEPFIGTWEHVDGNRIFRVIIYEDEQNLKGDYELVESVNGIETIIYESNYYVPRLDAYNGHAIFGGTTSMTRMGGRIEDNTIEDGNPETGSFLTGSLVINIEPRTCLSCPLTASWKVEKNGGMYWSTQPTSFNIPTDIIITKVE